jgi:outer membrane protein TolC
LSCAAFLAGCYGAEWREEKEAVPRAEQNVKVSEAAYAAGQIDLLALLDAQRILLMRQLERERALAEHAARKAELERAVGGRGEE